MEAVHILLGQDRRDDLLLIDMIRQRELDQDAVHGGSPFSSSISVRSSSSETSSGSLRPSDRIPSSSHFFSF